MYPSNVRLLMWWTFSLKAFRWVVNPSPVSLGLQCTMICHAVLTCAWSTCFDLVHEPVRTIVHDPDRWLPGILILTELFFYSYDIWKKDKNLVHFLSKKVSKILFCPGKPNESNLLKRMGYFWIFLCFVNFFWILIVLIVFLDFLVGFLFNLDKSVSKWYIQNQVWLYRPCVGSFQWAIRVISHRFGFPSFWPQIKKVVILTFLQSDFKIE